MTTMYRVSSGSRTSGTPAFLPTRLLVTDLPTCDHQIIKHEFEKAAGETLELTVDENCHSAYLDFNSNNALNNVLMKAPIVILGKKTNVGIYCPEPVKLGGDETIIEIVGIDKTVTEENMRLYFENCRRSGGGPVERVKADYTKYTAQVKFKNKQDAWRVLCKGRHRINGIHRQTCYPETPAKFDDKVEESKAINKPSSVKYRQNSYPRFIINSRVPMSCSGWEAHVAQLMAPDGMIHAGIFTADGYTMGKSANFNPTYKEIHRLAQIVKNNEKGNSGSDQPITVCGEPFTTCGENREGVLVVRSSDRKHGCAICVTQGIFITLMGVFRFHEADVCVTQVEGYTGYLESMGY